MDSFLLDQELRKANASLGLLDKAYKLYSLFMSVSLIVVVGLLILSGIEWILGHGPIGSAALPAITMAVCGFALAFWWLYRMHRLFSELRSLSGKLKRAGLVVCKKPVWRKNVISATERPSQNDMEILDFDRLDPWDLHCKMF